MPLLPYESCNLGSLNLARFATGGRADLGRLGTAARLAVWFLDDVIEVSRCPAPALTLIRVRLVRRTLSVPTPPPRDDIPNRSVCTFAGASRRG